MKQLSIFADENESPPGAIIGLDLSLRSSGYVIIDFKTAAIIDIGRIPTTAKMTDIETVLHVSDKIVELSEKNNVEYGSRETTFVRFKKTAERLAFLGGSVVTTFFRTIKVKDFQGYAPAEIKRMITGKGNCTKEDVAYELQKTYPFMVNEYPFSTKKGAEKTDDLYDALAVALCMRMYLINKTK